MATEVKRISLDTLSFIHIGTGEVLQRGIDFFDKTNTDNESASVYFFDYDKLGNAIERKLGDNYIYSWLKAIKERDFRFIKQFAGPSVSKKVLWASSSKTSSTIKEAIHDIRGFPYIPGSSLKGATRTVIISYLADKELLLHNFYPTASFSDIEKAYNKWYKSIFGDIEEDFLKNLQVGDAYFSGKLNDIECIVEANRFSKFSISPTQHPISQSVDVIRFENHSEFRIKKIGNFTSERMTPNSPLRDFCKKMDNENGLQFLFTIINEHSKRLLDFEVNNLPSRKLPFVNKENLDDYKESLDIIKNDIENCKPGECVIRIGEGSGWNFITGGWERNLNPNIANTIISKIYGKGSRKEIDKFPASFWISDSNEPFGFCKLSIID